MSHDAFPAIWVPDHVLRWIGKSSSPMGTEGESRSIHGTVLAGVGSLSPLAEKVAGKVGKAGAGSSGKTLAPSQPWDAPVQDQGEERGMTLYRPPLVPTF